VPGAYLHYSYITEASLHTPSTERSVVIRLS
jgi:hypothetical protein